MFRLLLSALAVGLAVGAANAQPFNVRAWYAQGQVFVIWQLPAPPAVPTDTVEIYASAAAQVNVANMTRVGRLFSPEYTGSRLQQLMAGARLQVPTPAGGTYRLAADEGVFAYTPHAAGNLFFAVVDTGSTTVNAGNSASTAFNYDPVNDPVRPQVQFTGVTPGGNPYNAYVIWADGRVDPNDARPDVPVLANANKNGVPHVFTISLPDNPLPPGPASCLFALHGGGGEYQLFRPGIAARANLSLELDDGIVVTPDDSIFFNNETVLERTNTSWFGYVSDLDPFASGLRLAAVPPSVAINYTQRRVHYILDWLQSPISPVNIDRLRVAMVGHSGGGRGTSHITRLRPERFCSVVVYTPPSDLSIEPAGRVGILYGDWDTNLETNVIGPAGTPVGVTDLFTMTTRLSPTQRDLSLTRYFYGKRDQDLSATWSPTMRAIVDSLNDSRAGGMIFWDEREHGVEKWDNETSDLMDGNPDPWPDVGQWVAPERTFRSSGQYLVDTYRANQSYPGFFNSDVDPLLPGRQLDPGDGDPSLGDPYGTWGGYFDWDTSTIVDTGAQWQITLFASGLAARAIDNSPYASITTDLIPRRVQAFNPAPGAQVRWSASDLVSGVELQSGLATAEADGVVVVPGLVIPKDPQRIRLKLCVLPGCQGDSDNNRAVNFGDITSTLVNFNNNYLTCSGPGDADRNSSVNFADITNVLINFGAICP